MQYLQCQIAQSWDNLSQEFIDEIPDQFWRRVNMDIKALRRYIEFVYEGNRGSSLIILFQRLTVNILFIVIWLLSTNVVTEQLFAITDKICLGYVTNQIYIICAENKSCSSNILLFPIICFVNAFFLEHPVYLSHVWSQGSG